MILMDIPEPKRCEDCPCSYTILTGEYAGIMMCNAMEFKANSAGFHEEVSRYFVTADDHRPEGCPIQVIRQNK